MKQDVLLPATLAMEIPAASQIVSPKVGVELSTDDVLWVSYHFLKLRENTLVEVAVVGQGPVKTHVG